MQPVRRLKSRIEDKRRKARRFISGSGSIRGSVGLISNKSSQVVIETYYTFLLAILRGSHQMQIYKPPAYLKMGDDLFQRFLVDIGHFCIFGRIADDEQ